MSRITPPVPVAAPPKGSIAEGWLWVSTFTAIPFSSSKLIIPALSSKTEKHQDGFNEVVAFAM